MRASVARSRIAFEQARIATHHLSGSITCENRSGAGDSAIYDLTFDSALSGDPFVANGDGWSSVAHVQGIGPSGDSGWIVAGGPVVVPEPAELGLFGVGALVIGLFAGLRRRWS